MALDDKDWERLREVFVLKYDCNKQIDTQVKKFSENDKRLAVIETYQKITLGILSATGVGVLGILLNVFSKGVV